MQAALTLVAAVMSIQTTLFGGVLKDVQHIYKVRTKSLLSMTLRGGGGGGGGGGGLIC